MFQKLVLIISTIVGLFGFGYLRGKDKEKNNQLKLKLKNAEDNQKFKRELDAVSVVDKRKFLRENFAKGKNK